MATLTEQASLWQLISPLSPVGAYHYSQGLEQVIGLGWVIDEESLLRWLEALLLNVIAGVDLPVICRTHAAWSVRDEDAVATWDGVSRACRETAELRDEERQMGAALGRLARELKEPFPGQVPGYSAGFGVMTANRNIAPDDALGGYCWAWCENQVAAGIKLMPLGQSGGQRILSRLKTHLGSAVSAGKNCRDEDIGAGMPALALASTLHERRYSRLFRS